MHSTEASSCNYEMDVEEFKYMRWRVSMPKMSRRELMQQAGAGLVGSGLMHATATPSIAAPSSACISWPRRWSRSSDTARAGGIVIIHAPSDTIEFYKDYPQSKRMLQIAKVNPPPDLDKAKPPLPIDAADGGCDTTP
jgi:hypothetical protein